MAEFHLRLGLRFSAHAPYDKTRSSHPQCGGGTGRCRRGSTLVLPSTSKVAAITIQQACGGVEEVLVFFVVFALMLIDVGRKAPKKAMVLLPVGLVGIYLVSLVRIDAVVLTGYLYGLDAMRRLTSRQDCCSILPSSRPSVSVAEVDWYWKQGRSQRCKVKSEATQSINGDRRRNPISHLTESRIARRNRPIGQVSLLRRYRLSAFMAPSISG